MRTERQLKIAKRVQLPPYLRELSWVLSSEVVEESLAELDATDSAYESKLDRSGLERRQFDISVDYLRSSRFRHFLGQIDGTLRSTVQVWTPRSRECGYCVVANFSAFNPAAGPWPINDGIVELIANDGAARLIFDLMDDLPEEPSEMRVSLFGPELLSQEF